MKVERFLKSFFCFLFSSCLILNSILTTSVFAEVKLPTGREDEFGENNIVFYNPNGAIRQRNCNSIVGTCNISGNTKDEKLWSGIRGYGFTPEQTAALMGNFAHEGGTPTTQEGSYNSARKAGCKTQQGNPYTVHTYENETHSTCMEHIYSHYSAGKKIAGIGLGFAQWTARSRREGYLKKMEEFGLKDTYFENDAYIHYGSLSDDQLKAKIEENTGSDQDYWSLWCAAIGWINTELRGGKYEAFFNGNNPSELAGYIASVYEVCSSCGKGQPSYNARVETANKIYQKYQNGDFNAVDNSTASSASANEELSKNENSPTKTSSQENGSNVFIIGDSITVRSEAEIKKLLPEAQIDAMVGRNWSQGYEILKNTPEKRKILVFALGSNNTSGINIDSVNSVIKTAGANTSVIFVTNYSLGLHTSAYNNTNTALKSSGAIIADWASAVSSNPKDYIAKENDIDVHPTYEKGTKLFAKTLYEAITNGTLQKQNQNDCSSVSGESVREKIGNYTYAFPIQGATKSNYLNPGGKAGESVLSKVPCGAGKVCHHDYPAVDLGINLGVEKASNHPADKLSDMYYFSTRAKVVALVGGKIDYFLPYTNRVPEAYHNVCGQAMLSGEDGKQYWMGHLSYPGVVKGGDTVKAGDVIGEIGLPQCAQITQAHLHINIHPQSANDRYIIDVIDALYEKLPN